MFIQYCSALARCTHSDFMVHWKLRAVKISYQTFKCKSYWFETANASVTEMGPVDYADDDGNNDDHSND